MQSLRASYDARPSSVPQARHAVLQALEEWGHGDLAWSAGLLTSELVSNALLHARTSFTVALQELPGGGARLEVSDGSRRLPRYRRYGGDATTGRGLHLLTALAEEWGSQVTPAGKTVWAVLVPSAGPEVSGDEHDAEPDLDALLLGFADADADADADDVGGHVRSA